MIWKDFSTPLMVSKKIRASLHVLLDVISISEGGRNLIQTYKRHMSAVNPYIFHRKVVILY